MEIHKTIGDLKTRVDLRREELKNKIDGKALSLIKEFEKYEK